MASLCHVEKTAKNFVHESFEMNTLDNDDHTFCGIMFDINVTADDMPVDSFQIDNVSVRGGLGHITVWTTQYSWKGKHNRMSKWRLLYNKFHDPSHRSLQTLHFKEPLTMIPGESVGLYIHSAAQNDDSIVYDNQRREISNQDNFVTISKGIAHLDCNAFGENAPWGGSAWRQNRSFVGKISYGVKYQLWSPKVMSSFPSQFRLASSAFCNVHAFSWKGLPLDIIEYILNFCPPSWFDCPSALNLKKKKMNNENIPGVLFSSITGSTEAETLVVLRYFRTCCNIL
mmetsp:Transcript_22735/g.21961  ORF Transcript_22735/g.21961 Transcript_22735/m.21961 type:complete len:285 (-) Transcript_22735:72-926(-)